MFLNILQVQDLKYATLATVSRCGMIWFSEDVLTTEMIFENYLSRLKNIPIDEGDEDSISLIPQAASATPGSAADQFVSPSLQVLYFTNYF